MGRTQDVASALIDPARQQGAVAFEQLKHRF